ncbi:tetratricopeptide repeat protein [Helicobacter kayseriensis]|uniref:tetratricopeptide repeat protein n=1 Tax=Helicobacter kayseriensis TaxID=2905877 RepID=UPI001E4F3049|nr:tetratricopeptide repeat protein [Helicobacter kayseriensis]MCE3046813.1 sel1 repeat family protein [Helicobacter kayseriensis]MCE3047885.1 sel1 repeat family protein [Helicobacter kayseriensis]
MKKVLLLIWVALCGIGMDFEEGSRIYQKGNYKKAFEIFKLSCQNGDMVSCLSIGLMYENAEGVEQDSLMAVKFFTIACDGGEGRGCGALGAMYENGRGVKKNLDTALGLYKKACQLGVRAGCEDYRELSKVR